MKPEDCPKLLEIRIAIEENFRSLCDFYFEADLDDRESDRIFAALKHLKWSNLHLRPLYSKLDLIQPETQDELQ